MGGTAYMDGVEARAVTLPGWRRGLVRAVLEGGGVIAYPTEGVWGLGCDPDNWEAVERILALKGRAVEMGLILIAARVGQLSEYLAGVPDELGAKLLDWPEATTYLVPDNGRAPAWIRGEHDTLALRVTRHPVAAALASLFGGALVSTSANPSGLPAALSALQVRRYFGKQVDLVVPGALGSMGGASEIRHLMTGRVIRPAQNAS